MIVHTESKNFSGVVTKKCEFCKKYFTKYSRASRPARFCNRSCASKHLVKIGKSCYATARVLDAAGVIDVESLKSKRSKIATLRNKNRKLSAETKRRISVSCTGIQNPLKGKTFVEFYGKEKAEKLAREHSAKLKVGFKSGRIKPSRSKRVQYKGTWFRSKLERDVVLYLERKFALSLGTSLLFEPACCTVQWTDSKGIEHTYFPDLYDVKHDVVYEVKPHWLASSPTDEMCRKMRALESRGFVCAYLTDRTILT